MCREIFKKRVFIEFKVPSSNRGKNARSRYMKKWNAHLKTKSIIIREKIVHVQLSCKNIVE